MKRLIIQKVLPEKVALISNDFNKVIFATAEIIAKYIIIDKILMNALQRAQI